jgi:hypothetical protein
MRHEPQTAGRAGSEDGSSYIEVLVASALLGVSLLTMCSMFVLGYANVSTAGKTTMGVSASRQLMEDLRLLPFDQLVNLDGFDTDDPGTLPASDPELEVARRWRYALAGDGVGWSFTPEEIARWTDLSAQGDPLGATGRITVTPRSGTLTQIDLVVSIPGRPRPVQLSSLMARM